MRWRFFVILGYGVVSSNTKEFGLNVEDTLTFYTDYFAKTLQGGETPLPDLKEGVHTIAIMEAMSRSLQTGAPVKVDSILSEYGII